MQFLAQLVDQVSAPAQAARDSVRALREELQAASVSLASFQAAGGRIATSTNDAAAGAEAFAGRLSMAGSQAQAAAAASSKAAAAGEAIRPAWAAGQAEARAASGAFAASGKAAGAAGAAAEKAGKAAGAAASQAGAKGSSALSAIAGKAGGAGGAIGQLRGALPMLLGALGVAGAASVAKLALGARGVSQLQAISARASLDFRRMFIGIDPSPVVRAYGQFMRFFSAGTATGNAMGDAIKRSFAGIFGAVERLEPVVTGFAQGMLLAFLYAEQGVLRARVALYPYTGALENVVTASSLMKAAAVGGGLALAIAAGYAVAAAAPFIALGSAIMAVAAAFEQASKLAKEWDDNSASQIWRKLKSDIGLGGSQRDKERAQGIVTGEDFDRMQREKAAAAATGGAKAPASAKAAAGGEATASAAAKGADPAKAAAAGATTGAAMAAGMVAGMKAGRGAVAAAGADLAAAADKGVRDKAEIRSPSRLFQREAGYMGAGAVRGIRDSKDDVERAAADAFVPSPSRLGGARGGGSDRTIIVERLHVEAPNVFDAGGLAGFVRGVVRGEAFETIESLGVAA